MTFLILMFVIAGFFVLMAIAETLALWLGWLKHEEVDDAGPRR